MKYLKQILLSITLLIVAPAFSQTAHDWQNVLKLVPVKIEENKRRIEAAKKAEEEAVSLPVLNFLKMPARNFRF